jgi:hypothetical protein
MKVTPVGLCLSERLWKSRAGTCKQPDPRTCECNSIRLPRLVIAASAFIRVLHHCTFVNPSRIRENI